MKRGEDNGKKVIKVCHMHVTIHQNKSHLSVLLMHINLNKNIKRQ